MTQNLYIGPNPEEGGRAEWFDTTDVTFSFVVTGISVGNDETKWVGKLKDSVHNPSTTIEVDTVSCVDGTGEVTFSIPSASMKKAVSTGQLAKDFTLGVHFDGPSGRLPFLQIPVTIKKGASS